MPSIEAVATAAPSTLPGARPLDATDARLLLALNATPAATAIALASELGISRNTVQARLTRLERDGALEAFERRVDTRALGYPLDAFVITQVTQRALDTVAASLEEIPEVVQVLGVSGQVDLLVHVVATDAEDLYRIAGRILDIEGVERTTTALVMREFVPYRITPLLHRLAGAER